MERQITTFENSLEGILSKRKHSRYPFRPLAPLAQGEKPECASSDREAEEDWGRGRP